MALWAIAAAGFLIYLITHEAGHWIAGAALGWRCVGFGIGPLEYFLEGKGWKAQRVKMRWGAFVRQVPPSFDGYRRAKAVTLLSGPMSSLVFGAAFATISLTSASPLVFKVFGWFSLCCLVGVLELIPRQAGGIGSDGYWLRQVLHGGQGLDDMIRDSMAEASNFTALRHRDWPKPVIIRLAAGEDPYDLYLAYLHTLDAGDVDGASEYMLSLIAQLPEENPHPHFACEAAYWLAAYGGDADEARKWMEQGQDVEPETRLRAEAAVALLEGQPDRAESLAMEALAHIHTPAACGSDEYELDRLNDVLEAVAVCEVAIA